MLSKNPVLPNFINVLVITSLAFGNTIAFAGHHEEGEKTGDLKTMKHKHAHKAEKMGNKPDADAVKNSLAKDPKGVMDKRDSVTEKVEKIKPDE